MEQAAEAAPVVADGGMSADRKRVKVYELKNNDWYDRGTGFCTGAYVGPPDATVEDLDARISVVSEEDQAHRILTTRITKDDGYQKQQDTLIVWTETNGTDMALSFQEAEGCASIWDFVSEVQGKLSPMAQDDGLEDDLLDPVPPISLPEPQLGKLEEVESAIRYHSSNPASRNTLPRYVMQADDNYILKLAPLVAMAEDLESVQDLHRLCTIMKHLILLNDTDIIEFAVRDEAVMGVVGALEYDPDFPSDRANHRQYLADSSRFKEVVPIQDDHIRNKIHWTYRLMYFKDVVLARILDDPTFSVLNSLIFFNQVDILNHVHSSPEFLRLLFEVFAGSDTELGEKKKDAVFFIQTCCATGKNIQAQLRAQLHQTFIHHGLFNVVTFALRHHDAAVRVAGTDILASLIDHDAQMVRNHMFAAIKEKKVPLTDTLIELLLVEVDLGVKSQMADAIKIILDPMGNQPGMDLMNRGGANAEMLAKQRGAMQHHASMNPHTTQFLDYFYHHSAIRLFAPLKALEGRPTMADLTVQETSLYTHLVEVLSFFARQHHHRSKLFVLEQKLHDRIAQLLFCPQKYMKLAALKWFRACIGLQDEFHNRQMIGCLLFDSLLSIVEATMPRDNLLNSACLELFEYIKRESVKQLIFHLAERYRERLMAISYVNTFQAIVLKYDQANSDYPENGIEDSSFTTQEGTPRRTMNGRQSFAGLREMDNDEEAYFNTDDDLEEDEGLPTTVKPGRMNGASPVRPTLVNYPDDDDDEAMDILASSPDPSKEKVSSSTNSSDDRRISAVNSDDPNVEPMDEDTTSPTGVATDDEECRERPSTSVANKEGPIEQQAPLLPIKRRREEEDEDELGKIMGGSKRRNSSVSAVSSNGGRSADNQENGGSTTTGAENGGAQHGHPIPGLLRRKGSLRPKNEGSTGKFAIKPVSSAAVKQHAGAEQEEGGREKTAEEDCLVGEAEAEKQDVEGG